MIPIKYCNAPPHTIKESLIMSKESRNLRKARRAIRCMNPNSDAQMIIKEIRQNIPNSRLNDCKYLTGVARMVLNGQITDSEDIANLNITLKLLSIGHANEYDNNLNGMAAEALIERFKTAVDVEHQKDVKAHNSTQFVENKQYKIYRIDSFEEAKKFSPYTKWCITHDEDCYSSYTGGGFGVFYFCIRDDFKTVEVFPSEGYPLDDYGLSMIATSVDEDGMCNTITCRWNHENNGNDTVMTPMQLSKLIGRNYYEVFKPYTKEELYAKGYISESDVQSLLDNGKNPSEIFTNVINCENENDLCMVYINNCKWNFMNMKEKKILCKNWYKGIADFVNGFARVQKDILNQNFVNTHGEELSPTQYQHVFDFNIYGLAAVFTKDKEWHHINTKGEIVD